MHPTRLHKIDESTIGIHSLALYHLNWNLNRTRIIHVENTEQINHVLIHGMHNNQFMLH